MDEWDNEKKCKICGSPMPVGEPWFYIVYRNYKGAPGKLLCCEGCKDLTKEELGLE